MDCKRQSILRKTNLGLYDLRIIDDSGAVIVDVHNVTFYRAVSMMEENMYSGGRAAYDGNG